MKNKSEREDRDDVGDQSYGAEESTPAIKIAEIDTLVSGRCGCSNENYVSVLVAQSIATIQHQVWEENRATKTSFSLACWQPPSTKKKLLLLCHSESAAPRDCTTLRYTVK